MKINYFTFLFILVSSYILIESKDDIIIIIKGFKSNNNKVGKEGTITLTTNYYDENYFIFDDKYLEETSTFETCIKDIKNKNIINNKKIFCRFWKSPKNNLFIFCEFDNSILSGEYLININNTKLSYKKENTNKIYELTILTTFDILINKVNTNLIDLYSGNQLIYIEKEIDLYEIKFKINSYNGEKIFLQNSLKEIILDKYEINNNKKLLIFKIRKAELEEILSTKEEKFSAYYLDEDCLLNKFNLVSNIKFKFNYISKIDVFLKITKLLNSKVESNSFITYETNVTNISQILYTNGFILPFTKNNENICFMRKYEDYPLLIICFTKPGKSHLLNINKEIFLGNINIKYNFIIQPSINSEIIENFGEGTFINWVYPNILNFTEKNDILVEFGIEQPDLIKNIKLNEKDDNYIKCKNKGSIKKCLINKNHFKEMHINFITNKIFTMHLNHLNQNTISYEIKPFSIILTRDGINFFNIIIYLILIGFALIVSLMVYLRRKSRKKNYNKIYNINKGDEELQFFEFK